MEQVVRLVALLAACTGTSVRAQYPVQAENTYYIGGEFVFKAVTADRCLHYCQKLGTCWGVDYFQYGGRCAVHDEAESCDVTAQRNFKGVDHFRVKGCVGDEYFSSKVREEESPLPEDPGLIELRRRLDAKMFTSNCYMNIYENSYVKSHSVNSQDGSVKSSGFLIMSNLTVSQCAELCWTQPNCKAFDFEKINGKCYVFSEIFNVNQLTSDRCCHHVLVSCFSDPADGATEPMSTFFSGQDSSITSHVTQLVSGRFKDVTTSAGPRRVSSTPRSSTSTPPHRSTTVAPLAASTMRPPPLPIKLPDMDKIVNKVCPFLVLPGTSRRAGQYVGNAVTTMEECQRFCLVMNAKRVTCYAVDWNVQTTDCFYFDTEDTSDILNYTDPYIYHFQYNPCDSLPQQKCIVHPGYNISSESVIVGPLNGIAHNIEPCDTFCFFKYSFTRTLTPSPGGAPDAVTSQHLLERGCGKDLRGYMGWRQCASRTLPTQTSVSIECHCVGTVCNSVGVSAFGSLYAFYPLDYDVRDLSGYHRHGLVRGLLKFNNLDARSAGAAAVFDGTASITIRGLTLVHRSEVKRRGDLRVSSALSMWVRRMYGKGGNMTIMSNAEKRGFSTIGIYSDVDPNDVNMHTITVKIRLMGETFSVKSNPMESGTWHFICMNIRDSQDPPVMALYVTEMIGLPPSEVSTTVLQPTTPGVPPSHYLELTSRTLTLGKQSGPGNVNPFLGELDELHFFQGELSEDDIWALMVQSYY